MLTYNPPKRLSAREAMTHPYFDDLDKSTLPAANINKIWNAYWLCLLTHTICDSVNMCMCICVYLCEEKVSIFNKTALFFFFPAQLFGPNVSFFPTSWNTPRSITAVAVRVSYLMLLSLLYGNYDGKNTFPHVTLSTPYSQHQLYCE